MKGCRPLTTAEVKNVLDSFGGKYEKRDRALFSIGIVTGFRISEILSLTIADVKHNGDVSDYVKLHKRNTKGKTEGRTKQLPEQTRQHIREWIEQLDGRPETYLFKSRQQGNRPITRVQAHRILKAAFHELSGNLATHAMRKTHANQVYDYMLDQAASGKRVDPIRQVQATLGHRSIASTESYLSFKAEPIPEQIFFQ